jgi:hypothetical protein
MPAIVNACKRMIIQDFYKIQILLTKAKNGRNFHKSPEFITKYVKNFPSVTPTHELFPVGQIRPRHPMNKRKSLKNWLAQEWVTESWF